MTPSGRLTPDLPAVDDTPSSSKKGAAKGDNGYLAAPGKGSKAR